jgi:hypothetical protein
MSNYVHIISPHFDDAIFSLSDLLLNFKGTIKLITVFTKECKFDHLKGDYVKYADLKHRKYEDTCAMEQIIKQNPNLKLNISYFDLPDHIFRSFGQCPISSIKEKLSNEEIDHIYCPLAIGEHPDHIACYKACSDIFPSHKITYYSEYPYNTLKLNLFKRLFSLNMTLNTPLSWKDITKYYNHTIYNSCPRIIRLYRIISTVICYYLPYSLNKITFTETEVNTSIKKNLMMCYKSQIEPIFGKNELDIDSKEYTYTFTDVSS